MSDGTQAGVDRLKIQIDFLQASDGDKIMDVRWRIPDPQHPELEEVIYTLDFDPLKAAGLALREAAQQLASRPTRPKGDRQLADALRPIAEAGAALFDALLRASPEVPDDAENVSRLRDWYKTRGAVQPFDIEVRSDPSSNLIPYCPWGLVFCPDELKESRTLDDIHSRFWALRHRVTAFHNRPLTFYGGGEDRAIAWKGIKFYAYVRGGINVDVEVQEQEGEKPLERVLSHTKREIMRNAEKHFANTFYYVNRRDRDGDRSTSDDRLNPEDMTKLGDIDKNHALAVLDGISVMKDSRVRAWYNVLQEKSWCAFLATEVDTDEGALDYIGLELIHQLIQAGTEQGSPLLEIMDEVRRSPAIRPWGLMFGVYAQPGRIELLRRPPDSSFQERVERAIRMIQLTRERNSAAE